MTATSSHTLIGLDVGMRRIGVARGDTATKLAFPETFIAVDGQEYDQLQKLVNTLQPALFVVGYPRNQAGEPTAQTAIVEQFSQTLERFSLPVVFQDESLTSVLAEDELRRSGKPYSKGDIDACAAAIILRDYLEARHETA